MQHRVSQGYALTGRPLQHAVQEVDAVGVVPSPQRVTPLQGFGQVLNTAGHAGPGGQVPMTGALRTGSAILIINICSRVAALWDIYAEVRQGSQGERLVKSVQVSVPQSMLDECRGARVYAEHICRAKYHLCKDHSCSTITMQNECLGKAEQHK
jgi:hypothetical protein